MQLMAKIETLEASQQSLAREPRTGAQARQEEAGEKRPEEAGRAAGASTRREEAEPLRRVRPEASPEETASSSSWARQKERGDPTPSEAFGSAMPLSKAKSATNRPQSSTEWPTHTETLEQFVGRCFRNFRGNPDTVQGYAQRMEQVWLTARFQTEEDRMKRGKGPQMDSDPRSRPGYNPFPSTYRQRESRREGRTAKATSIRVWPTHWTTG